jgi:hypothetical protein
VRQSQPVEEILMWLAAGYFDESIDQDIEDRCFSMAGFYGSQFAAAQLDLKWKDTLGKWNLKYFKASEIEFGFGQFTQHRDFPDDLNRPLSQREKALIREIKTAFVDLICDSCRDGGLIGVGVTLVLRDFYLFRSKEPELSKKLANAYTMCGDMMLVASGLAMKDWNESCPSYIGFMQPIFDSQEEYGPRFKMGFPVFARKNPKSSQFLKPPMFEAEEDYRCLQASDLLAFESRKLLINTFYDPNRPERVAMSRLREHVDRLYLLDYEALKLIASQQRSDAIAVEPKVHNHHEAKFLF